MAEQDDPHTVDAESVHSSSPRRHSHTPSWEASSLLSPVGSQRTSSDHERYTQTPVSTLANPVEDGCGAQGSASTETSNSASTLNEATSTQLPSLKNPRMQHWKTIATIMGFLLGALLSALGHYLLVRSLDGKLTETSYLPQAQVSAVSILLTTIFKTALTASVGICFAQHLWFILHGNATSLATIEKLFAIRTNLLALGDFRVIWRAPLLFLMALLVWCLGLATITPPGALIVTFEAQNYTDPYNMSVMNPPIPQELNLGNESFPGLIEGGLSTSLVYQQNTTQRYFEYWGPVPALVSIAKLIIVNSEVLDLPRNPGENATYDLQFKGPQLRCTTSQENSTFPLEYTTQDIGEFPPGESGGLIAPAFESKWRWNRDPRDLPLYSVANHTIMAYTVQRTSGNVTTYEGFRTTWKTICRPHSVLYDVKVSFPHGIQTIQHSTSHEEILEPMRGLSNDNYTTADALTFGAEAQVVEDWTNRMRTLLPLTNEWALLEALGTFLDITSYESTPTDGTDMGLTPSCDLSSVSTNGIALSDCVIWNPLGSDLMNTSSPLEGTVFDIGRFGMSETTAYWLDPRRSLNLTESLLNDVLTNITLSAISLGTWWDNVPVTTMRYQSTYSFASPLHLILPYSICLAAAIFFAIIAIWSLWRNGVPAADGGFLQIMIATRGNTEMERLVLQERLTAIDNISQELKNLKIRYGELVGEDVLGVAGRRLGFGTVEETVSLRKKRS